MSNKTFVVPLIPTFADTAVSRTLGYIFMGTSVLALRSYIDAKLNEQVFKDEENPTSRIVGARLARLTAKELRNLAIVCTLGNRDLITRTVHSIATRWQDS